MRAGAGELEPEDEQAPLISTRFLVLVTLAVLLLSAASVAISWFGRAYGERLSLAGHTESTEIVEITIGRDQLSLPANTIRFEQQRLGGNAERVDLYLLWPELTGYSSAERRRFDDLSLAHSLIFLQMSQSTMSRDMSGRVEPIYRHLINPGSDPGPGGLEIHRFRSATGYEGESLLTGTLPDGQQYAIRCTLPELPENGGSSDCQRDIHVGEDLSVLYRFSSRLLPDWQAIDDAVRTYVKSHSRAASSSGTSKNPLKASTDRSS